MPSKLQKFLAKLSATEHKLVTDTTEKLIKGDLVGLNIKKLEGQSNVF